MWYAGSFAIGVVAGVVGDRVNLGFVVEGERQVEHLTGHMENLPASDARSRATSCKCARKTAACRRRSERREQES
jgi:demethoxyubiquinone hydroxylase (CLK1/Coq7/Cat5 family)